MLGSLSRKLRALGVDTAYYRSGDDRGLALFAASSGRVILTADRRFASTAARRGTRVILITGKDDHGRFRCLIRGAKDSGIKVVRGDPLCSACGSKLEKLDRSEAVGIPPAVLRRHRVFHRCPSCGKVYWRGGHWKRLSSFASMLKER